MSASFLYECKLHARDLSNLATKIALKIAVKIVSFVVFAFEVLMT